MVVTNSIKKMISEDIEKIDSINTMTYVEKKDFYIELTSKYNNMISNFGNGLYGYYRKSDFYDEDIDVKSLLTNFKKIQAMLCTFKANDFKNFEEENNHYPLINNAVTSNNTNNNSNLTNINISFEEVRKTIQNMDNLNDNELSEILSKIDEIESIIQSNDTKRNKWNKLKSFLIWLADKGVDVAIAILPLLLKINRR